MYVEYFPIKPKNLLNTLEYSIILAVLKTNGTVNARSNIGSLGALINNTLKTYVITNNNMDATKFNLLPKKSNIPYLAQNIPSANIKTYTTW